MARSLNVQIAEVERELRMRRLVYPGQIARKKYRRAEAEELIAIMEDVLASLLELRDIKNRRTTP